MVTKKTQRNTNPGKTEEQNQASDFKCETISENLLGNELGEELFDEISLIQPNSNLVVKALQEIYDKLSSSISLLEESINTIAVQMQQQSSKVHELTHEVFSLREFLIKGSGQYSVPTMIKRDRDDKKQDSGAPSDSSW